MKYTNVSGLVPKDEHFDETAVNEGIWLSATHLAAIDAALGTGTAEQTRLQNELNTANSNLTARQTELETANANLATANTTIQNNTTRIAELEKKPAVAITQSPKEGADQIPGDITDPKDSYLTSADEEVIIMRQKLGYK